MIPVLAWPAAVLVGLSLGLLGSGGSILTVPLLHEIVGLSMPQAVVTSLPIVGWVAGSAVFAHARRGHVHVGRALPFAIASVVAAFGSRTWLSPLLPTRALEVAFALLMLVVAWRMAFGRPPREETGAEPRVALAVAAGLATGTLTGLFGVGGGFLIVPALVLFLRLDVRRAVGTSLVVIALNCLSSLAAEWRASSAAPRWDLVAVFAIAGTLGAVVGGHLAHRLPPVAIRRTFAVAVVGMAALLLLRAS